MAIITVGAECVSSKTGRENRREAVWKSGTPLQNGRAGGGRENTVGTNIARDEKPHCNLYDPILLKSKRRHCGDTWCHYLLEDESVGGRCLKEEAFWLAA